MNLTANVLTIHYKNKIVCDVNNFSLLCAIVEDYIFISLPFFTFTPMYVSAILRLSITEFGFRAILASQIALN